MKVIISPCGTKAKTLDEFPSGKPNCCGKEMYACGGVIGKRSDGLKGDIEHCFRCEICGQETNDLLAESERVEYEIENQEWEDFFMLKERCRGFFDEKGNGTHISDVEQKRIGRLPKFSPHTIHEAELLPNGKIRIP